MAGWGAFIGRGFVGGQKKTWGSYLRGHESSEQKSDAGWERDTCQTLNPPSPSLSNASIIASLTPSLFFVSFRPPHHHFFHTIIYVFVTHESTIGTHVMHAHLNFIFHRDGNRWVQTRPTLPTPIRGEFESGFIFDGKVRNWVRRPVYGYPVYLYIHFFIHGYNRTHVTVQCLGHFSGLFFGESILENCFQLKFIILNFIFKIDISNFSLFYILYFKKKHSFENLAFQNSFLKCKQTIAFQELLNKF